MNTAQKSIQERSVKAELEQEKQTDKIQIVKDMISFDHDMSQVV